MHVVFTMVFTWQPDGRSYSLSSSSEASAKALLLHFDLGGTDAPSSEGGGLYASKGSTTILRGRGTRTLVLGGGGVYLGGKALKRKGGWGLKA